MIPISNSENDDGPSPVPLPAPGLPPPLGFRGFGVLAGSLFGLPPRGEGPSAAGSTVC